MRVVALPLLIALAVLWSVPLLGHHSFAGTYDADKQVTIKGKLAQYSLRSPHSFFYVDVDNKGTTQRWAIEGGSANQFAQQGADKDGLKVGDPVEVLVNPARSPNSIRARLLKITRTTDNKSWGGGAE
jgi:hypothetical protein